jgi:hypothetical protein
MSRSLLVFTNQVQLTGMALDKQIEGLHSAATHAGEPGYIDPTLGLFVLTADSLRRQGRCCGGGCRHCPFSAEEQVQAGRKIIRQD